MSSWYGAKESELIRYSKNEECLFLTARRSGEDWSSSKVTERQEGSKVEQDRYSFKRCKWPFRKN